MRRIRVSRHTRIVRGKHQEVPAHWRHIASKTEEVPVERDEYTLDMFSDIDTICALASMPDGAVITGPLMKAARKEWK